MPDGPDDLILYRNGTVAYPLNDRAQVYFSSGWCESISRGGMMPNEKALRMTEDVSSRLPRAADHREAGRYWNENAEAWTRLSRAGYDLFRDHVNTPAFFDMLPDVAGLHGLDIGCGEGHNTRLLRARRASVTALDYSEVFIRYARAHEAESPRGIRHLRGNALALPFPEATFDFVTAFMSLMEFPETELALSETFRVLKPGGFLQFSITHPCFITLSRKNILDESGRVVAVQYGDYFDLPRGTIEEWTFPNATEEVRQGLLRFKVPDFRQTMCDWVNLLATTGFVIQGMQEPRPSEEAIAQFPHLQAARIAPFFVQLRAGKP